MAALALAAGIAPDLWPFLQVHLRAQSGPIPRAQENSIYKVETVPYAPRAMNASSTVLPPNTDSLVTLPFEVAFYGTRYSKALISDDGYIEFEPTIGLGRKTDMLPRPANASAQRALLVFNADMTGTVAYLVEGVAPNRVLTVDWSNERYAYDPSGPPMAFQAQLFESGAPPLLMYASIVAPPSNLSRRFLQGTSWATIGTDAGDRGGETDDWVNYTQIFAWPYPAPPPTGMTLTHVGYALLETPGPTTQMSVAVIPGTPLVGEMGQIQITVTAGGEPVVGGGNVTLFPLSGLPGTFIQTVDVDASGHATFAFPFDAAQAYRFAAEFYPRSAPHYLPSRLDSFTIAPAMALSTETDFSVGVEPGTFPSGRPATFAATVTAVGRTIVDGSVRFTVDNVVKGTVPVADGFATLHSSLIDGSHNVTAQYLPVNRLIIGSSKNRTIDSGTSIVGVEPFVLENQYLVAQVSGAGNVSGGSVTFEVDGVSAGTAPVTPLPQVGTANIAGIAVVAAPPMTYPAAVAGSGGAFVARSFNATVSAVYSGSPTVVGGAGTAGLSIFATPNAPNQIPTAFPAAMATATSVTVSTLNSGATLHLVASTNLPGATGRMLFFVDTVPVGVANVVSNSATLDVPNPAVGAGHVIRAAFLGKQTSATAYLKPSTSAAVTIGSFAKKATTTTYTLQLGTRLGQPVWTVNADVTTPGGTVADGSITVNDANGVSASALVSNGHASITFVTPQPAANNQTLLRALNVTYTGTDLYQSSTAPVHAVRGYPTQTTAVAVNPSGGNATPDYTVFDATVKMVTFENLPSQGAPGSLQIRDGQGGALLSDQLFDWVYQTTERLTSPHALPLTMVAYSGQVWQEASGDYTALMPSGVFLQHPNAQARMTQSASESPYEWINIPGAVPVFSSTQGVVTGQVDALGRCDDCFVKLTAGPEPIINKIPWTIRFLSTDWPQLYVNQNGVLSFTQGVLQWDGVCPPAVPSMGPLLAGFWADHDTRAWGSIGGAGPLQSGITTYQIVGQAPQRVAVFQWDSVNFYPSTSNDPNSPAFDDRASFQIHLYEDNRPPRVALRYGPKTHGLASLAYPTIGVDYGDGVHADLLQCTTNPAVAKIFVNEAYEFQLALTNTKVTIEPSQSPAFAGQPLLITGRIEVGGPVANGTSTMIRTSSVDATPVTLQGNVGVSPNETIFNDTPPVPGNYSYTFSFNRSPGEPYVSASTSLVVPVVPGPLTRTSLSVLPLSPVYGEAMTLKAIVTTIGNETPAAPAPVTFKVGSTVLGTATSSVTGSASLTATAPTAGTQAVTAAYASNTSAASTTTIGVDVQRRDAIMQPAAQVVTYGSPVNGSAYSILPVAGHPDSGLAGNDSPAFFGVTLITPANASSGIGAYPLTASAPFNINYNLIPGNSSVTVVSAGLTAAAPNLTKVYGDPVPPLTPVTYTGFVNNESPAIAIARAPVLSSNATATSPVGPYPISISGGVAPNYTFGYVSGTLNVTPATLTVTGSSHTKIYGDPAMPALSLSYAGFVGSDTVADLDVRPTVTTTATPTSAAGNYPTTPIGGSDDNYVFNRATGVLTIKKAALQVNAQFMSKIYGDPVVFTPTLTGLVNGDTWESTGASLRYVTSPAVTQGSPAGSYPLSVIIDTPATNYDLLIPTGPYLVKKRPLTVVVDSKTRPYGLANPGLTGMLTGVVAGDGIGVLYQTSTAASFPVGDYPIVAVLDDPQGKLPNYVPSITQGTLTVTRAPLNITAPSLTRAYGAPNPPLNASIDGMFATDGITATVTTTATASSPVGTYPATITLNDPLHRLGNYDVTLNNGTVTVAAVTLTVSADDKIRTYGAANPELTGTITGAQAGDDITVSYSTTATATTPVTQAPLITPVLNDPHGRLGNYTVSITPGRMSIRVATLQVTVNDVTRGYGQANPELTGVVTGIQNGDDITFTYATAATPASDAGTYPIGPSAPIATMATILNYSVQVTPGTLTVEKAPLNVIGDNKSRTFGAANPPFTGTVTGLQNGDAITAAFSSNTTPATPTGGYPIVSTLADPAGKLVNYTVHQTDGTLTIDKAALTITADNKTKVYGAAMPALSASYSGFVNNDSAAVLDTPVSLTTAGTAASGVGSYPITAAGAADQNYAITFVDGSLAVSAAPLTVTAENKAMTYGGTLPPFTATYSGFVNGDNSASLALPVSFSTVATAASATGQYAIVAGGAANPNYDIAFVDGTLTINRAALTITADNAAKTYGAAVPAFTATYAGFVNGDTFASLDAPVVLNSAATAASTVGAYPITAAGAADANYDIAFVAGTLNVTRAALRITADDKTKVYGAALPALTASYSGFVNGDDAAALDTPVSLATPATAASSAGSYAINASGATDHNYDIQFVNGSLSISRATLTITADDKSKIYGAALPVLTASYAGFVNGDDDTCLSTAAVLSTMATQSSAAGHYDIVAAAASSPNYDVTFVNGTMTVDRAALTITADDQSKVYGAALPAFTASYSGLVNGDTIAAIDLAPMLSSAATASSAVGSYGITAAGASDANYDISYASGTLSVTRAPLTITAENKTKPYGASLPVLTASYGGFVNGDDASALAVPVSVTTTATSSSDVGTYPIVASAAISPNYDIAFVEGALTVGKAALTITADHQSKVYGDAMPSLTASYSGFVNGDDASDLDSAVALNTAATAASSVGSYPITASGASDGNYAVSFVAGAIDVTKAALTVTANDASKVYGAALPLFGASYVGFVNGDTAASLDTPPSFSTPASAASHTGSYDVVPASVTDANYTVTFVKGRLLVTPAPLTVTADGATKSYGAALPPFSATYAGFVNADTPAVLDVAPVFHTTATVASPVGTYAITATGAVDADYEISYVAGTLTVTKATVTITANDATKLYGAANPMFSAAYSGLVNGDTSSSLGGALTFATAATATSAVGTYDVTPAGVTSANYLVQFAKGSLTITYNICLKSDGSKPAGGTEKVQVQACDANGQPAGGSGLTLTALKIQTPAGAFVAVPVGNGQYSNGLFQYGSVGGGERGYTFHLRTQSLPSGSYDLVFSVNGDPSTHTARFTVR